MTLIAGLWHRGGAPAGAACAAMIGAQAPARWRRGVSEAGGIALARAAPASADGAEAGPLVGAGGAYLLAADLRLDNRAELAGAAGLAPAEAAALADARLAMLCFERWGVEAVERFVGDFALALWDGREQRLVLARDFAGQRPLHFHAAGETVALASMASGLHALEDVPRGVDERRMLEMLAGLPHEGSGTFFEGIERVQPGEMLIFERDGARAVGSVWTPPADEIRFGRDEDYADALRERLDEAVAARLAGAGPAVATQLSAGLDSSAVTTRAALAFAGRVVAFTSVTSSSLPPLPAGRFGDEGALAAQTAGLHPNIEHRLIETGDRLPLEDLEWQLKLFERPDLNLPNLAWSNRINDAARSEGIGVMLVATMGNSAFSYGGLELLGEALARGQVLRFLSECAALRSRGVAARTLLGQAARVILPTRLLRRLRGGDGPEPGRIINPALPARAQILARQDRWEGEAYGSSVAARVRTIRRVDPGSYNKGVLVGWGIDLRDPTADRRLVDYCLRVPLDRFLRHGTTRALARTALKGRIPEAVRLDMRRGLQSPHWFAMFSAARQEAARQLAKIAACAPAARLLNVEWMRRLVEEWPDSQGFGPLDYRYGLLRGLSAGTFIRLHACGVDRSMRSP